MILPYRYRRFFRGLGIAALVLVIVLIVAWLIWMLWLDRYVIYTQDGVILDFEQSATIAPGQVAVPPQDDMTVSIYYNEGDNTINISTELTQVYGYYIDVNMLEREMATVMSQLKKLPPQTPVLVEVKDIKGRFFFSTSLGPVRSTVDTAAVESLFDYLRNSDLYTIAKFPALRDYNYGLNNVSNGIFHKSGMGLWMDDDRCYWLNPASQGTQSYLIQIITELKLKGFDEVVLGDYAIPVSGTITYKNDRTEALTGAAVSIMEACATDRFAVSFCVSDPSFPLPEGRARIYMEGQSAANLKTLADKTKLEDTDIRLVFITDVNDTRFDDYGVLRPLNTAHLEE